jgi:hypothetical protein
MFKNRVLRGIFGSDSKKVTRGMGNLCNKLHNLHSSLSIVTMVKSKRMRWEGPILEK